MNTMIYRDAQNIGFAIPSEYLLEEIAMFKEDRVADGYYVRCPSCACLLSEEVVYCENCGVQLENEGFFEERPLDFVEQFVESQLSSAGVDPCWHAMVPPVLDLLSGLFVRSHFRVPRRVSLSAAPLARLPRKNLVELFQYLLSDAVAPYRFTLSNDVIHLSYRVHLSDLEDDSQRERIGQELIRRAKRPTNWTPIWSTSFSVPGPRSLAPKTIDGRRERGANQVPGWLRKP